MVTVKRRNSEPFCSPLPLTGSVEQKRGSFGLIDGLESPRVALVQRLLSPSPNNNRGGTPASRRSFASPEDNFYRSRKSLKYSSKNDSNEIHWLVKLVYAAAVASFLTSLCISDASPLVADIESEIRVAQAHLEHNQRDYDKVYGYIQKERQLLNKLKKTRKALDHEVRMMKEVRESSGRPMKPQPRNEQMIQSWLSHRKDGLLNKIDYLQSYLQAESRAVVLEKYGAGPHRVQFTIDLIQSNGRRQTKSFMVELAPVDLVPHSILFFLDTIGNKLWDHTVFLHHEDTEHVVAAAPIDYTTQRVKHLQLSQLGWIGLGFPEYSAEYTHQQYTLGYSGQGPTFYINSVDNTDMHGPGGQGHHLLETDADPCFAKVVQGVDVVAEMIRLGANQKKSSIEGQHPWADDEHTWTHIVSAEIVTNQ